MSTFLHAEAEAAEFFAEAVVFAVGVGEGRGVVELELACAFVDEVFFGVDGHHVGDEHVVAAEAFDVDHAAFDVEGKSSGLRSKRRTASCLSCASSRKGTTSKVRRKSIRFI